MNIDSHVHTQRCGHAIGSVDDMVGASSGLDVLTLTEHLPLPDGLDPAGEYAMPLSDMPLYVAEVREAKAPPGVSVLLGFETDWLGETSPVLGEALRYEPDVILGSVHFLDDWVFDDPGRIDEWEGRDVLEVWERYFAELIAAAESRSFDVMSHPDLIKKFNFAPQFGQRLRLYDEAAAAFAASGVAIEVSTGGLRKPCAELYPAQEFLVACARAGVAATTGSDAHCPGEVGYRLDLAKNALARAGYSQIAYFVGRERRMGDM